MLELNNIIYELNRLIGAPPQDVLFLQYLFAGCFLMFLVHSAVSLISGIFKWIGGF